MGKLMFIPVSALSGILAGIVAKKLFDLLWRGVDEQEAPKPDQRAATFGKLVAALVVEGAVFRLVRGLVDRGARVGYARVTGRWPGEEAPES
jgi:hypothetical protein